MVQNSNNTQLESTLVEMEQITLRPLTQESADAFMQYLNSHVSIKDDPRTSELIETFERQLQQIQASWAQEKLRAINEVRLARTELAGSVQVEVTQSHPLVSSESLQAIGISITEALRVAELAVGTPVTAERIKNYQSDQGISIDQINVRIGKETYCEMRAGELRNDLKNNFDDINWLKDNMESAILVLQNGNRAGKNMVELAVLLEDYKSHHEEKPEFERMYGDFYRNEMNARRDYAESEAGQETQRRAQEQAAPLWDTLTDPNIPVNDKIEAAISNPTLLLTAGILFLFGVV